MTCSRIFWFAVFRPYVKAETLLRKERKDCLNERLSENGICRPAELAAHDSWEVKQSEFAIEILIQFGSLNLICKP